LVDREVLGDDEIEQLVTQTESAARVWLARLDAGLPPGQRASTVTLDFEFKHVAPGWPATIEGRSPSRLVIKQARTLDPGLRLIPAEVRALPIPRDVLARARSIRDLCGRIEVLTDPLVAPDMGYSQEPFVVAVPPRSECSTSTLYRSRQEYLLELLATGTALALTPPPPSG
jgi:hypothetical protein